MSPAPHVVAGTLAGLALLALTGARAEAAGCDELAGASFGPAHITAAGAVAPPFGITGRDPPRPTTVAVPFCRVEGTITPSADSDIRFELWLPPVAAWNGKYEGVGNGGFAGSLIYPSMSAALAQGYAVSGTDTGHAGSPIDSRWALGHPEKIKDFGWRGIHETAIASKAILAAYYGHDAAHAYFAGCSDGGREALMEAQRFPTDYDGIVAGAPANNWVRLVLTAVWDEQALMASPASALPAAKLPAITAAVLAACHGSDGYLDDPRQCHFDPSVLRCQGAESASCLTDPQIATLRRIYAGPQSQAGTPIFPGFEPGGEAGRTGWGLWITGQGPTPGAGSLQLAFAQGFFGDFVFDTPNWNVRSMNFDADLTTADRRVGAALDAMDTDLSKFRAAGGKLIQYHGWNDPAIPPQSSINYYESVAQTMGGVAQLRSFYRLFMAPGMSHCGMGAGPNAVGGVFGLPAPSHDPAHDVVAALAHWVEDGVAPDRIVATRYQDNDPTRGIAAQRPWCAYPAMTTHASGAGEATCTAAAQ
jgi:hypothetical protein